MSVTAIVDCLDGFCGRSAKSKTVFPTEIQQKRSSFPNCLLGGARISLSKFLCIRPT